MNQLPIPSVGNPQYSTGPPIHPFAVTIVAAAVNAPAPTITQMAPHIPKAIKGTIMPKDFYHLKAEAPAQFSTFMGKEPKREVPNPKPAPIVRANLDIEIQRKADSYRLNFPDVANAVTTPTSMYLDFRFLSNDSRLRFVAAWYDLHLYFDGHDLYLEGAAFLFFVLNHMSNENTAREYGKKAGALAVEKRKEIFDWADDWIACNREKVLNTPTTVDMYEAMNDAERGTYLGELASDELNLAKVRLKPNRKFTKATTEYLAI